MARRFVIVPAAGGGARFGGAHPKQYADLGGMPVIARTLQRLASLDATATIVALAPDDARYATAVDARSAVESVGCGGATRADTVRNALAHLAARAAPDDWIVVHDAARPCVSRDALARLLRELADEPVGGLLALPVADTLKRAGAQSADGVARVARTEDRASLWQAQTPQMFRHRVLAAAFDRGGPVAWTDEAQAVEALAATGACAMPRLVVGEPSNLKITYAADLALARAIVDAQG